VPETGSSFLDGLDFRRIFRLSDGETVRHKQLTMGLNQVSEEM
jgi:hypothetical protein